MTPLLSELPVEVIENICSHLYHAELHSLRLTCKALCQKSLHYCSMELFSTILTVLSRKGLQRWEELLRNDEISKGVRVLHIYATEPWADYGKGFEWNLSSFEEIPASLPCLEALRQILKRMPKCSSVLFETMNSMFTGREYSPDHDIPPESLALIWGLMAENTFTSLKLNLDTKSGFDRIDNHWSLEDGQPKPAVKAAWANLTRLTLNFVIRADNRTNLRWLRPLLASANNIQALELCISEDSEELTINNLLDCVGTYSALNNFTLKPCLVTEDVLFRFLLRHATTLHSVNFDLCFLVSDTSWGLLLVLLRDNFPLLTSIALRRQMELDTYTWLWFEGLCGEKARPGAEKMNFQTYGKRVGRWAGKKCWVG